MAVKPVKPALGYFELIRLKGRIYTSHANYFMVISGVLWGMVIFAERMSPLMWFNALLLIVSLYLISSGNERVEDVHEETS